MRHGALIDQITREKAPTHTYTNTQDTNILRRNISGADVYVDPKQTSTGPVSAKRNMRTHHRNMETTCKDCGKRMVSWTFHRKLL